MPTLDDEFIEKEESNDSNIKSDSKHLLVNESSIFYKGLFGMILCLTPGSIIGLVLVNMSLNQSKEVIKSIGRNSQVYYEKRFRKVRYGRGMALIGLGLFIFEVIALIVLMSI